MASLSLAATVTFATQGVEEAVRGTRRSPLFPCSSLSDSQSCAGVWQLGSRRVGARGGSTFNRNDAALGLRFSVLKKRKKKGGGGEGKTY